MSLETKRQVVGNHRLLNQAAGDASGSEASRSMTSDITNGDAAHKKALVTWIGTLPLVPF